MNPQTFAAARAARLTDADAELEPFVRDSLEGIIAGDPDPFEDLVTAASVLWLEHFKSEAPNADGEKRMASFQKSVTEALELTESPGFEVSDGQVNRVTYWLSGYTVNHATVGGVAARGGKQKLWVSHHDDAVREDHENADGQIVPIGATFTVGGYRLHFPGEPVGPPEIWINCRCLAMPAAREGEVMSGTTYVIGPEDAIEDNPDIIPGSDVFASAVDEGDIAVEPPDEEDLPDDQKLGDDEYDTSHEVPVHGVLAPEGVRTGDGREFAIGSLSTRTLPVPLRYEIVGTHGGMTSEVVTVGRIDEAWRNDETNEWEYNGVIITDKPHADEALAGIRDGSGRGVSIDGDDAEIEIQELESDEDLMEMLMGNGTTVFTKMRVAGLTIVPIPAFQEAYIAEGHEFREVADEERKRLADEGNAMPDGSFPIANVDDLKNAIQAIGRAKDPEAAKRHIKKRARELGHEELIPEEWGAVLVASAIARLVEPEPQQVYPSTWFSNPGLDRAVPLRIDKSTRRVFGYVAEWGTCHVGMTGMCQDVPRSSSDYGFFLKGILDTDEGEQPVGCLTFGGHAKENMRLSAAAAYYDKPDAVRAFVNVGEDEFGIWFSGIIPEDVSDKDIDKMRAIGAVSGDWREIRGSLELIGVPVVNTPGFPIRTLVASAGRHMTLIGAGALKPEPSVMLASASVGLDADTVAAITRTAVAEYRHQENVAARAEPARAKVRERRLQAARARAERG